MGELLGVNGEKNVFFELHNKPLMLVISSKTKNPAKFLLLGLPLSAGSNLPCSNQKTNENPEELKDAEIQRFLADLRAISHFFKVFRVGQK